MSTKPDALTSWQICCDTSNHLIYSLGREIRSGLSYTQRCIFIYKQKKDGKREVKTEKMKRCVFSVSQPIHYVGVKKGMYVCK